MKKFTDAQIATVRVMLAEGSSIKAIQVIAPISATQISLIKYGAVRR